jgi:Na+/melibiose symporter-like transporter
MDWLLEQWQWVRNHEELFVWIGSLSLLTVIVSFIAVPMVIRRMPHDYFLETSEGTEAIREQHPALRLVFLILKNLLGLVLVAGGLIMFFTPGQGILTLVIGLLLMNFPGKRRFEIRLIRMKPLRRAVDWIRRRAGQRPLELPDHQT